MSISFRDLATKIWEPGSLLALTTLTPMTLQQLAESRQAEHKASEEKTRLLREAMIKAVEALLKDAS